VAAGCHVDKKVISRVAGTVNLRRRSLMERRRQLSNGTTIYGWHVRTRGRCHDVPYVVFLGSEVWHPEEEEMSWCVSGESGSLHLIIYLPQLCSSFIQMMKLLLYYRERSSTTKKGLGMQVIGTTYRFVYHFEEPQQISYPRSWSCHLFRWEIRYHHNIIIGIVPMDHYLFGP
jgi:hypothetical protein